MSATLLCLTTLKLNKKIDSTYDQTVINLELEKKVIRSQLSNYLLLT